MIEIQHRSFFGKDGISATSANHIANMAKELRVSLEKFIERSTFISTTARIIGEDNASIISVGRDEKDLQMITDSIESIGKLNALIAYLREAIKEKESLTNKALNYSSEELKKLRKEYEDYRALSRPAYRNSKDAEEIINNMSVGKLTEYYALEAMAAAYGKYIHEGGAISEARKNLQNIESTPNEVKGSGRDTIIYTHTPSVDSALVADMFFDLQRKQRSLQSDLNGMKKKIEDEAQEDSLAASEEYKKVLQDYNNTCADYERRIRALDSEETTERMKYLKEIKEYKIVIPKSLKEIYDAVAKR